MILHNLIETIPIVFPLSTLHVRKSDIDIYFFCLAEQSLENHPFTGRMKKFPVVITEKLRAGIRIPYTQLDHFIS